MSSAKAGPAIDREALVRRHNPKTNRIDPFSTFAVGNGEFAFNADITGLQTFPESYKEVPLCTQSQWGWHTTPHGPDIDPARFRYKMYDAHGRQVGYASDAAGQEDLFNWLRENPHRLHLGQIGFVIQKSDGSVAAVSDLEAIDQELDLWTGTLKSRFSIQGQPVSVETSCDPNLDAVAVSVRSPLLADGRLAIRVAFPYGSPKMDAADWNSPDRHITEFALESSNEARLTRRLDDDAYNVAVGWTPQGRLRRTGAHEFVLRPDLGSETLEAVFAFSPIGLPELPSAKEAHAASARYWEDFWSNGGAVELAESADPRALELERRVVLSQFLTAIHSGGSAPPQESGLVCNSWYGKPHLEMHWWHAIHFPIWGRAHLLERSLDWYQRVLPLAQEHAKRQGYAGARWPKMVGPDGADSPSPVATLLIWQQPHPLMYAEMCYRERPTRETLRKYAQIVFETATFMVSFARFNPATGRYVLGPPVIPAQENHPAVQTWNPTYEVEYWRYGLQIAQAWRERMGYARKPDWDHVIDHLPELPTKDGVYLAHENCPNTFTERNYDHPSMLAALGVLPGEGVDRATMRRTLEKVMAEWQWDRTWGWDFPVVALCAAKLGMPEVAIEALSKEVPKNKYLNNGHNWQRENLPVYLPGNGGLLLAVAAMAAGWEGGPDRHAPGFPADGSWTVRWEGLKPWV